MNRAVEIITRKVLRAEKNLFILRMFLILSAYVGLTLWLNAVRQTVPTWLLWTLIAIQLFLFLTIFVVSSLRLRQCRIASWWLWVPFVLSRINDWEILAIPVWMIVMLIISERNRRVSQEREHLIPSNEDTGTEDATMQKEVIAMNEPISEMDKQLRDTPDVSLVVAIVMNKGKRNACLFFGIIALVVILSAGWSKWLLLLPAALGIGAFLYQMNILIGSSELKRRSEEPEEEPTPSEEEELEECLEAERRYVESCPQAAPTIPDIPERVGFAFAVVLHAGIAGAIVGVLWALALSFSLFAGGLAGACINSGAWLFLCDSATARGRITQREAIFVMGGVMSLLCGLAAIVALVVWGIRALV